MTLFPDKNHLSPGQLKIADFIERHPEDMLFMTEREIADRIGTSVATVSRFWRAIGSDNAKSFKLKLREHADATPALKLEKTMSGLDAASLPAKMLEQSIHHLEQTAAHIRPQALERTAELIASARRLYIHAPGPSLALGELMAYRLNRFGLSVRLTAGSGHELLESLAHLQAEDVIFAFSFTRMLPETEVILDCSRRIGAASVLVTDREELTYGVSAREAFCVSRGEVGEFHSMMAPLLLVEQLILGIGLRDQERMLGKLDTLAELRDRYADKLPRGRA